MFMQKVLKKRFEVVEVYKNGIQIKHYLHGTIEKVNKDIEAYRKVAKTDGNGTVVNIGKNGMLIVWG